MEDLPAFDDRSFMVEGEHVQHRHGDDTETDNQ